MADAARADGVCRRALLRRNAQNLAYACAQRPAGRGHGVPAMTITEMSLDGAKVDTPQLDSVHEFTLALRGWSIVAKGASSTPESIRSRTLRSDTYQGLSS